MSDVIDDLPSTDQTIASRTRRPFGLDRHYPGLQTYDLAVAGLVFLILTVQLPVFFAWWHTPRLVLLVATLPVGLFVWWTLACRRDLGALIAAAAVAWMSLAALLSGNPLASLKGYVGEDGTALIVLGGFALWALARRMSVDGVRFLIPVVLAGLTIQAGIAVLQHFVQADTGMLALFARRSTGFTANPVYLGGLMAAAFSLTAHLIGRGRHLLWAVAGMFLFATALGLSGSRVALAAALAASAPAAWRLRHDLRQTASIPIALIAGQFASVALANFGDGRSSTDRLGETSSSEGRIDHWVAAWDAFLERPIAGFGPNRFRAAVQEHVDASYFRAAGSDADVLVDAHNVVIGTTISVGVVGLVLFGAFAVWTIRRVRGPMAWAALAIVITWFLQPANIVTTAILMTFVGAATVPRDREPDVRLVDRVAPAAVIGGLVVVGLILAAPIAIADVELERATSRTDADAIAAVGGFHSRDPIVTNLAAKIMWPDAADDAAREVRLFELVDLTIEYDDDRPEWWTEHAGYSGFFDRLDDVEPSVRRAIELQPTNARAWSILLRYARDTDDAALEAEAMAALCLLGDENCDLEVENR
jgi:O-antigen ligase